VKFFVDRTSLIRLKNGNVQLWERQEFAQPDEILGSGMLYLFEVDCSTRKFQQRTLKPLHQTGEALKLVASMEEHYAGWQDFEPNDLDETRLKIWCGN